MLIFGGAMQAWLETTSGWNMRGKGTTCHVKTGSSILPGCHVLYFFVGEGDQS